MKPEDFRNKRITVMGLGLNQGGLGIAKWLLKHGAKLVVTDLADQHVLAPSLAELETASILLRRHKPKGRVHPIEYVLGQHREKDFRNADMVIKNPAVPNTSKFLKIARKKKIPIETDVSLFFRMNPHPTIGVTGSKGKTTVTTLLGEMLKREYGRVVVAGNFGKSPMDALDSLLKRKKPLPIALELSSWGLESLKQVKKSPELAVVTNVFHEHLNRYKSFADYAAAKELIFKYQSKDSLAIMPFGQAVTGSMGKRVKGERVWISDAAPKHGENGIFFQGYAGMIRYQGETQKLFLKSDLKVPGEHMLQNALVAAGAAWLRGVSPAKIRQAIRVFKGVPHRLELVKKAKGVSYWNDTTATHPEASMAAMNALGKKKNLILLAGGADKALQFGPWAKMVKKSCKHVFLFEGTAQEKIERAFRAAKVKNYTAVRSMTSAVYQASQMAKRGDVVLLSPGAASFGLFQNEFERGNLFRKAAKRYAK